VDIVARYGDSNISLFTHTYIFIELIINHGEVFTDKKSVNLQMLLSEHTHFLFFTSSRFIKKAKLFDFAEGCVFTRCE